jgi:hypothetical protein
MSQNVTVNFDQEKLEDGTGSGNVDELTALKDSRNNRARIPECSKIPPLFLYYKLNHIIHQKAFVLW